MLAQIEAQPGEDMQLTQLGVRNSMLTAAGEQARRSLVRAFRTLDESNTAATAAAPASLRRGASAAGPASRDDALPL